MVHATANTPTNDPCRYLLERRLLSAEELVAFRRLAVFSGGFDLAAAVAVTGEEKGLLRRIAGLVDQSLVYRINLAGDGVDEINPRFGMLETLREFGLELLEESGEAPATREAHFSYFLAMAEADNVNTLEGDVSVTEHAVRIRRLTRDHDNLRAAMAWVIDEGEAERATRLVFAMGWFWHAAGLFSEGRQWLKRALSSWGGDSPVERLDNWHRGTARVEAKRPERC